MFLFDIVNYTQEGIEEGTVLPYGSKGHHNAGGGVYWQDGDNCGTYIAASGGLILNVTCTGRVLEEDAMNY